ncbi:MAG: taurine dioxygenase [Alphaproteobacteria bacterium]|nr:taurine dioxygenase [Alphaproteobacteria bacterium]
MAKANIAVKPLTPSIGAEIEGVNLARLDDDGFATVHQALMDHLVLFFRDQDITAQQHLAFARRFGEVEPPHPVFDRVAHAPEVTVIEQHGRVGVYNDEWHTDVTFRRRPPLASILHCQVAPEVGGDTLWASMYAAYETLSEPIKRLIEPLTAVHDITGGFMETWLDQPDGGIAAMQKAQAANPPVIHPVVRTHPVTGRPALFVNRSFTVAIRGLSRVEGRGLLDLLLTHAEQPSHQVRFRWQAKSLAIWDNRVTQHFAAADYAPHHRKMHRVTVIGDEPFFRA